MSRCGYAGSKGTRASDSSHPMDSLIKLAYSYHSDRAAYKLPTKTQKKLDNFRKKQSPPSP